jgi:hypothetical protein
MIQAETRSLILVSLIFTTKRLGATVTEKALSRGKFEAFALGLQFHLLMKAPIDFSSGQSPPSTLPIKTMEWKTMIVINSALDRT